MPHRIVCPYCDRKGLVRAERIITAAAAKTQYFCGACLKEWIETDSPPPPPTTNKPRSTD